MDSPVYRKGTWWQHDGKNWRKWDTDTDTGKEVWTVAQEKDYPFPPPPSRWRWQIAASEPFQVYLLGVLAAIAALGITLAAVSDIKLAAAILAPVFGLIGAFAGHAAGHSSAVAVMRENKTPADPRDTKQDQHGAHPSGDTKQDQHGAHPSAADES